MKRNKRRDKDNQMGQLGGISELTLHIVGSFRFVVLYKQVGLFALETSVFLF